MLHGQKNPSLPDPPSFVYTSNQQITISSLRIGSGNNTHTLHEGLQPWHTIWVSGPLIDLKKPKTNSPIYLITFSATDCCSYFRIKLDAKDNQNLGKSQLNQTEVLKPSTRQWWQWTQSCAEEAWHNLVSTTNILFSFWKCPCFCWKMTPRSVEARKSNLKSI